MYLHFIKQAVFVAFFISMYFSLFHNKGNDEIINIIAISFMALPVWMLHNAMRTNNCTEKAIITDNNEFQNAIRKKYPVIDMEKRCEKPRAFNYIRGLYTSEKITNV